MVVWGRCALSTLALHRLCLGRSKEEVGNDARRGVEDSAVTCQGGGEEKGDIVDSRETKKHMS